jgi:hypothetical protein
MSAATADWHTSPNVKQHQANLRIVFIMVSFRVL